MAQGKKVQIKGLLRFSYLSENGFAKSTQGLEQMRAMLYEPARMMRRFALFERLALHTLKLQEDQDFTVAILIGEDFPAEARSRLEDLLHGFDAAHLVALPPMVHIQAVKAAYDALPDDPAATHIATFRQDDDDAMHRDTIGRVRKIGNHMLGLRETPDPFVIAFNRGLYLNPEAEEPVTEWYERAPLGIGLAMVAEKGNPATVFRRNHRQFMQYYDCYTEVAQPMWIRSVHQDNDSGAQPTGRAGTLKPVGIRRCLRRGFGLNHDMLATLKTGEVT
ncbi:glycosyltransferase [Sulfitobacter sp. JB4-11]|uniref:glycosyltransferase n=1 Tax=Sulfitobacter rhodophyticola TaxID=3238304 RepID=UPI0035113A7B